MRAIRIIAVNTFREALRDKVLYLFLGFAVLLMASSKVFGILTVGDQDKIIKDLGLAGIQFFLMLIAVMMSVLLISREIDSKTVYYILAKPVRRWWKHNVRGGRSTSPCASNRSNSRRSANGSTDWSHESKA